MNVEIKKLWVEALLSGKYVQGEQKLRRADNTYCCLGVLCDLKDPNAWEIDALGQCYLYDGSSGVLPKSVEEWADLTYKETVMLTVLNDRVTTFEKIADVIEKVY